MRHIAICSVVLALLSCRIGAETPKTNDAKPLEYPTIKLDTTKNQERTMLLEQALQNQPTELDLSDEEKSKLERYGFVLTPSYSEDIYDLYYCMDNPENISCDGPAFISTDLYLNCLHQLTSRSMRIAELKLLLPKLKELLPLLLKDAMARADSKDPSWELVVGYLAVPAAILGLELPDMPQNLSKKVEQELKYIEEASDIKNSPLLRYKQDYTQFKPRGHYSRTEELKIYFKASMWLGRNGFRLNPKKPDLRHIQAAVLLGQLLAEDKEAASLWKDIDHVLSSLAGSTDDITPFELLELAKKHPSYPDLSSQDLKDLAKQASEAKPPRILSDFVVSTPDKKAETPVSCRLLGQRFSPDAFFISNLIFDKVVGYQPSQKDQAKPFTLEKTQLGPQRCFARGLDVLAVMGDDRALAVLAQEHDTDYKNYGAQMQSMREWWKKNKDKEPGAPASWLSMIDLYVNTPGNPPETQAEAWHLKKMLTGLGAWAQMKHDFVLYSKQPYTAMATAAAPGDFEPPPRKEKFKRAWLEDTPETYSRGKELALLLAQVFSDLPEVAEHFKDFAKLSDSLIELCQAQREHGLTQEQHLWLWEVPQKLNFLEGFDWELMDKIGANDEEFPCVADVLTDVNTRQCLEVAVGKPNLIKVLVKIDGKPYIAQGTALSYYEFKQPMSERLTDEEWWRMDQRPGAQSWIKPVMVR